MVKDMNDRLTLYDILRILFKQKNLILGIFCVFFFAVFIKVLFFPAYEASATIMLQLKKRPTTPEIDRLQVREEIAFIHTNITLLKSKPIVAEVVKRLSLCKGGMENNQAATERKIKEIDSSISVESATFTNLVNIKVKRKHPKEAADIANTLIEVYRKWTVDFLHEETTPLSEYIDDEINKASEKLTESEEALRNFKAEKGIMVSDDLLHMKFEDVSNLYEQLARDSSALEFNRLRLLQLEDNLSKQGFCVKGLDVKALHALISNNKKAQFFKEALADIEVKLAYYMKTLTADHPAIISLLEQKDKIKQTLYDELCNIIKPCDVEDAAKKSACEEYLQLFTEIIMLESGTKAFNLIIDESEGRKWAVRKELLPYDETKATQLKREVSIDEFLYNELHEDKIIVDLLKDTKDIGLVHMISPATVPLKPKGRLSGLVFGNMLGLFLAMFTALIVEYRNHSFKRPREIEADLKIPILEVIPRIAAAEKENMFIAKRTSIASDRFFKLASKVLPAKEGKPSKVIQVTSSISSEGKTFVALNLGIMAADMGYNVLLADANFKNPSLHAALKCDVNNGLLDLLKGMASVEKVIKRTAFNKLHLITCGASPTRATTVFSANNFIAAIGLLKARYDIILIDTPPVNPYADALVIAEAVDGAILVVQADSTQKESVFIAKKMLGERCKIIGSVLNDVRYYVPQRLFSFLQHLNIS